LASLIVAGGASCGNGPMLGPPYAREFNLLANASFPQCACKMSLSGVYFAQNVRKLFIF
jgi:hypothetical protein